MWKVFPWHKVFVVLDIRILAGTVGFRTVTKGTVIITPSVHTGIAGPCTYSVTIVMPVNVGTRITRAMGVRTIAQSTVTDTPGVHIGIAIITPDCKTYILLLQSDMISWITWAVSVRAITHGTIRDTPSVHADVAIPSSNSETFILTFAIAVAIIVAIIVPIAATCRCGGSGGTCGGGGGSGSITRWGSTRSGRRQRTLDRAPIPRDCYVSTAVELFLVSTSHTTGAVGVSPPAVSYNRAITNV